MRKTIIRKSECLCTEIGEKFNVFTYLESLILILLIEMGGHLAPECLWILDRFEVSRERVKTV